MTNKEAIKVIDDMLANYGATYSLLNVGSEAANKYYKCMDALNVTKVALKKQIPEKPVRDKYGAWCCPTCGSNLPVNLFGDFYPACSYCGQLCESIESEF